MLGPMLINTILAINRANDNSCSLFSAIQSNLSEEFPLDLMKMENIPIMSFMIDGYLRDTEYNGVGLTAQGLVSPYFL